MTDNDIIKALECCKIGGDCKKCPYKIHSIEPCGDTLKENVIDLINRQKAEINFAKYINGKTVGKLLSDYEELQNLIQNAKAEAVKEFAERFKEKAWIDKTLLGFPYYQITFRMFNNLVKEMVGEINVT